MVENKKLDKSLVMEEIAAVHPSPTEELLHLREQLKTEKEQKVIIPNKYVQACMHAHTQTHTYNTHTNKHTQTRNTHTQKIVCANNFKYSNRTYRWFDQNISKQCF